jgi:hypothetical protein
MAEIILRIVGALIEGLIDQVFESTGRKLLSYWGIKSNLFVEVLAGILFWGTVFILCTALIVAFLAR